VTGIEDDQFVIREGDRTTRVGNTLDVPLTVRGAARFQFENILAAVAAAFVLGVTPDDIRAGLMSFIPSDALMPGRLNMVTTAKGRILIDYAHNAAAIAGLMDFVSRLDASNRIGVIGAPGDRRDEDLRELGRLCGVLDYVIVKEVAKYRRGRHPGDTARVIAEGLASSGLSPKNIEIVDDEPTAVARALERMHGSDLVIVLADDHAKVRAQIASLTTPA
jgi:cyanophycin synthetase